MADFSLVKDEAGVIRGLWLSRDEDAQDEAYVTTLFLRSGVPGADVPRGFRVVSNTVDSKGGCFVMLGSTLAPGENTRTGSERDAPPNEADYVRVKAATDSLRAKWSELLNSRGHQFATVGADLIYNEIWKASFPKTILPTPLDLSGADLAGAVFAGHSSPLSRASFRRACLDKTVWSNTRVVGADFTGASMRECLMIMFRCSGCIFREADLSSAVITALMAPTDGGAVDFSGANLSGAKIQVMGPTNLVFSGAHLQGCRIGHRRNESNSTDAQFLRRGVDQLLESLSKEQRDQLDTSPEEDEPRPVEAQTPRKSGWRFWK